jgi:Fe-S-cluster containining protein
MEQADGPIAPWFDAGLRFKCTGCGRCCTGSTGSVYVSSADIERLARFLRLPAGRFVRRYTRVNKGRRVLVDAPGSGDCVFLRDKACSVYEARPTQCRTFPWWLTNLQDGESWAEAARTCEGINYPDAALVPASEILEQLQLDVDNESGHPGKTQAHI